MSDVEILIAKHQDYWLGRLHENMSNPIIVIKEMERYLTEINKRNI